MHQHPGYTKLTPNNQQPTPNFQQLARLTDAAILEYYQRFPEAP